MGATCLSNETGSAWAEASAPRERAMMEMRIDLVLKEELAAGQERRKRIFDDNPLLLRFCCGQELLESFQFLGRGWATQTNLPRFLKQLLRRKTRRQQLRDSPLFRGKFVIDRGPVR